jgi:hypothetical protein
MDNSEFVNSLYVVRTLHSNIDIIRAAVHIFIFVPIGEFSRHPYSSPKLTILVNVITRFQLLVDSNLILNVITVIGFLAGEIDINLLNSWYKVITWRPIVTLDIKIFADFTFIRVKVNIVIVCQSRRGWDGY